MCTAKVRETLTNLDGVDNVSIDFEKKTASVSMKAQKSLTKEAVEKALKDQGFGVTSFDSKSG